jgi:hypothetical protein
MGKQAVYVNRGVLNMLMARAGVSVQPKATGSVYHEWIKGPSGTIFRSDIPVVLPDQRLYERRADTTKF